MATSIEYAGLQNSTSNLKGKLKGKHKGKLKLEVSANITYMVKINDGKKLRRKYCLRKHHFEGDFANKLFVKIQMWNLLN